MSTTPIKPISKKKSGLHLSRTSLMVQQAAEELQLDEDGDGKINTKELENVIQKLLASKKDNQSLLSIIANIAEKENVGVGLIRIAHLPDDVQAVIQKLHLDKNDDGLLDADELGVAFKVCSDTKKDNKKLRYSVVGLVLVSILLVCCVFGASITATRLSKDTSVDPVSGIMYQKGSNRPIQTAPVQIRNEGVTINEMETRELDVLQEISLDDGAIKFQVTGYAKSLPKHQVTLLVDGGSLIYGEEGLVAATGMAETLFHFVYPDDTVSVEEGVRRTLRKLNEGQKIEISSSLVPGSKTEWSYCEEIIDALFQHKCLSTHIKYFRDELEKKQSDRSTIDFSFADLDTASFGVGGGSSRR